MERLAQRDLRVLSEFLRELYVARDVSAFCAYLIATLSRVVPADLVIYRETNPPKRQTTKELLSPANGGFADSGRVYARHMHENPLLTAYKQGKGSAVQISDFLARAQFHRTGLYNEFFRRLGVEHLMVKGLPAPPPLIRAVSLFRSRRGFSERDRLVLNLLRFHLIQGYQNAEVVTRMQQDLDLARQGAEDVERGVIVLTPDGRMQTATARARQWLTDYWGNSPTQPDNLPEALQRWIRHHITILTNKDDAPPARGPLIMEREGRRLVVRLLSDAEQHLLLLEEQYTALPSVSLASLGLSRRETEVLTWVAQGRSNSAVGTILGISEPTVKKHLEHIYAKLGVWNRTEAAACAVATLTSRASSVSPSAVLTK